MFFVILALIVARLAICAEMETYQYEATIQNPPEQIRIVCNVPSNFKDDLPVGGYCRAFKQDVKDAMGQIEISNRARYDMHKTLEENQMAVEHLAVKEEFRSRGVATALLTAAGDFAKRKFGDNYGVWYEPLTRAGELFYFTVVRENWGIMDDHRATAKAKKISLRFIEPTSMPITNTATFLPKRNYAMTHPALRHYAFRTSTQSGAQK